MSEILRKIVTHGTGKRPGELYVDLSEEGRQGPKIRIPSFGKTGTTNDFYDKLLRWFYALPNRKV